MVLLLTKWLGCLFSSHRRSRVVITSSKLAAMIYLAHFAQSARQRYSGAVQKSRLTMMARRGEAGPQNGSTKRTSGNVRPMSAFRREADIPQQGSDFRL